MNLPLHPDGHRFPELLREGHIHCPLTKCSVLFPTGPQGQCLLLFIHFIPSQSPTSQDYVIFPWTFRTFPFRLCTSIISSFLSRNSSPTLMWERTETHCLGLHFYSYIAFAHISRENNSRQDDRDKHIYFRVCGSPLYGSSHFSMWDVILTPPTHGNCSHQSLQ